CAKRGNRGHEELLPGRGGWLRCTGLPPVLTGSSPPRVRRRSQRVKGLVDQRAPMIEGTPAVVLRAHFPPHLRRPKQCSSGATTKSSRSVTSTSTGRARR